VLLRRTIVGVPGTQTIISATIHNNGATTAENVEVRFGDFDDHIATEIIPAILPGGSETVSPPPRTWTEASFRLITVTVDPNNAITESDETNNSGAKVYQVGEPGDPEPNIVVSGSASAGFCDGTTTGYVYGQAVYDFLIDGKHSYQYPVKGGSVLVSVIYEGGTFHSQTVTTNTQGSFAVSFPVPGEAGDEFSVEISVTDGTPSGDWLRTIDVTECTDLWVHSADIVFSNGEPDPLDTVTITATIHASLDNPATVFDVPVTFWEHPPASGKTQIGSTQTITELAPRCGGARLCRRSSLLAIASGSKLSM